MKIVDRGYVLAAGVLVVILSANGCGGSSGKESESQAPIETNSPRQQRSPVTPIQQSNGSSDQRKSNSQVSNQGHGGDAETDSPPSEHHSESENQFTPEERKLQVQERAFCEVTPSQELASEYGVPNSSAAIAHAVGLEYRNRLDMQIAAETGCLEGLDGG